MIEKEEELSNVNQEIISELKENGHKILAILEVCNIELGRVDVEFKMRRTKSTCVLWGWIPPKKFEGFKSIVNTYTGGSAVVEYKESFDRKFMPSYVEDRPKFYPPVRGLVTSFGTPSTKEIDPYIFVGPLFVIFFAIMFGDVGHGTLLTIIGYLAKRKKDKMLKNNEEIPKEGFKSYLYNGAELMIWMGIFSFISGLFLGSLFGDETILWDFPPLVAMFSWSWKYFYIVETIVEEGHEITEVKRNYLNFLIFSFGVGAATIILGILLKIYQLIYYRHNNAEIFGTISLLTLYVSGILALLSGMGIFLPGGTLFFGVLIILSLFGVIWFEGKAHGFDGAMEAIDHILALLSNTFSFGRLLAMNTVHFVLAFLPYLFFDLLAGTHTLNHETGAWTKNVIGSGSLIPWIISAAIGAVIVLIVETIFSTLQALRLTWVEFFGKFYKGEGIPFEPVTVKRIYTKG